MKPLMTLLGLAALAIMIWLGYQYWHGSDKNSPQPVNLSISETPDPTPASNSISPMDQVSVTVELPGDDEDTLIKSETPPSVPGSDSRPVLPELDPLEEIGKPIEEAQATPTPAEIDNTAYDRAEEARRIAARQLNYEEEPGEEPVKPDEKPGEKPPPE